MKQELKENGGLPASILWTLAIVAGVSVANIYYNQPLLNLIRHDLDVSEFQANLITVITQVGYALGLLFIVPLGDLYHRKNIILTNFTLLIFSLLAIAWAPNIYIVWAASLLTGIGSMIPQIFVPIASQFSRPENKGRTVGMVISGLLTGILASRVISGYVGDVLGWREMYLIAAGLMVICAVVVLKVLPDIRPTFEGKYSDLHKLVAMIVEKGAQLDFNSSFSIENIRKLTEEDKVDFGGDFQRILIEGYKWINIRLLYDKSIQKDYAVLCFKERDIEKKRELEHIKLLEESVEAMKDASVSKSMFYSGLSHDMRTPLNAIIGLTDLVEYHIKDEEKIKDYMDKMKFAGNQLITLIDNFLDYSKNEFEKVDTEVTNFNLKEYLSELVNVFKLVAKNDGKKFIYNYNVKHNNLKGNTAKLYRIITNLLGNSFKYSRQNDTITFDVKEITSQGCPKFQFIISDTGIGMSEEFINKVCSPYQREKRFDTNKAGVGLGMAIVKNYVQYLNGDMQIESKLNEGTKITVTLAFEYSDEEIKDEEEQENIQYDISGLSILVVEDNNVNMYLVTELLSIHNVKVTQAWNGKEAVDIFESNPPHTFDVILMDLQMPVMDGIEAAKTIRHIQRKDAAEIPIIALSANVYTEDVAASSAAGMNGHLSKPINFDALCKAIYHALKNKY